MKYILLYTGAHWGLQMGSTMFEQCEVSDCFITRDVINSSPGAVSADVRKLVALVVNKKIPQVRSHPAYHLVKGVKNTLFSSLLNTSNRQELSSLSEFDAVLFNYIALNIYVRDRKPGQELPDERRLGQRYVMFFMEAPLNFRYDHDRFNNFFNWTMTYRQGGTFGRMYISRDGEVPLRSGTSSIPQGVELVELPVPVPQSGGGGGTSSSSSSRDGGALRNADPPHPCILV